MMSFISALPGAISQGLIWGIMAIGVYITYKILDIADLTVDGSFCTGGAVFAVLFGAWVVEAIGQRRFTRIMSWGMVIAAVAGLALAAPWGIEYPLNYTKLGVKLVILLIIGALLGIGTARQRKTGTLAPALFWSVGVLTFVNAAIAAIWR